jgi:hypothetical protein
MADHCCDMMALHVNSTCDRHANRHDCPDCLIDHWPDTGIYGIIVHDGGSSMIVISHCPWCGTNLTPQATSG